MDLNVIGMFCLLVIVSNEHIKKAKSKTKLVLQIFLVIDAVLLIINTFFWVKSKDDRDTIKVISTLVYCLAFVEIGLKVFIWFILK